MASLKASDMIPQVHQTPPTHPPSHPPTHPPTPVVCILTYNAYTPCVLHYCINHLFVLHTTCAHIHLMFFHLLHDPQQYAAHGTYSTGGGRGAGVGGGSNHEPTLSSNPFDYNMQPFQGAPQPQSQQQVHPMRLLFVPYVHKSIPNFS